MATKTKKGNGKTTAQIQQEVTDRVISSLNQGNIPWRKPWKGRGAHSNLASKHVYRGINQFLLTITMMEKGYESPYWVTFKQAKDLGGTVKGGEESTMVVFWKILKFKDEDSTDDDAVKIIPLLKYFRVFNVEQCEGFEDKIPQPDTNEFSPIDEAERICKGMTNAPKTLHRYDSAFYRHTTDTIGLPKPEMFDTPEHYYATRFHEMIHSTGHGDRVGRVKDWTTFGTDPYAQEELVAEMGAAMLAGLAGTDIPEVQNNEAAYIQHWVSQFKEHPKMLVQAGSQAHKAVDYIIGEEAQGE